MSVANIKQEPLDSFDVEVKNGAYENAGSSGHVTDRNSKPINEDEMLHVMSIINRCEQESGSPGSDDARTDGQFTVNGCDGEFKHECSICNARFKSARAFRGHGVIHRLGFDPIKRRVSSSETGQDSGLCCRKNGFDDSPFKCDNCQAVFGSRDTYAMHMLMRAKDENCKARAQAIGIDVDALSPVNQMSPRQLNKNVKVGDGLYNQKQISKENSKMFSEYKGLMPDYVMASTDSREMLACQHCGEVFPSKDTLAMHAMFHTHEKEHQGNAARWAVIYSSPVPGIVRSPVSGLIGSPVSGLVRSPVGGIARSPDPGLVQRFTPEILHRSQTSNGSPRRTEVGQEHKPAGLPRPSAASQGLDLSLSSPRVTLGQSALNSRQAQTVEKTADEVSLKTMENINGGRADMGTLPAIKQSLYQPKDEVVNKLFCYSLKSPKASSTYLRTVSADSGAAMLRAQGDLVVKGETSVANILHRPKSTDCSIGGGNTYEEAQKKAITHQSSEVEKSKLVGTREEHQSYVMNKMKQLRKSRFPMRKLPYGFRPLSRSWRQPETKHLTDNIIKPDVPSSTAAHSSGSSDPNEGIAQLLNLKSKDFSFCKYCEIVYLDRTLYQLHMGLHNVNNPWQCNACGKVCRNRLDFSSHVLHY